MEPQPSYQRENYILHENPDPVSQTFWTRPTRPVSRTFLNIISELQIIVASTVQTGNNSVVNVNV